MTVIGFAGLGRMGTPMCANLVRAGYRVVATDLRPECEQLAGVLGAEWSAGTAATAAMSDVLITMLPGPPEVHDALLGAGGALAALAPGATWLGRRNCMRKSCTFPTRSITSAATLPHSSRE